MQTRILTDEKRFDEAYQIAASAAAATGADVSDLSRLGDVLQAMKRNGEAADAYGAGDHARPGAEPQDRAVVAAVAARQRTRGRQPLAGGEAALQQGLAIAPDQPLLLNFLGYAELERGENVDSAEAMIRKASELSPDDASITDSLGWAQFKRGKVDEAIATLQKAAEKDPARRRSRSISATPFQVRSPLRGAVRMECGAGYRRGRDRRAGQGQAGQWPDARQRRALTAPRAR